jgi:PAS domain S-box-containing protein
MRDDLPEEVSTWIGKQLFEHVPSNIVVIDHDFNVVLANGSFTRVFGEATGKRCYEVFKKREAACETCMAAQTFEDGEARVYNEYGIDRKGRPAYYVVHNVPIRDDEGAIAYVIEMSYDLTDTESLQRQYNILFERVPCYVAVLNRDLKIVRANELLRSTFGESKGLHCFRVYKQRQERCEDCPALKTFADGGSYTRKQVGIDKTGCLAHYVVSTAPISKAGGEVQHVIEMSVDVTETQKLAQDLLKESYFRHQITENAFDALIGTDSTGIVNIFNPSAEKLFKVSAREVIGRRSAWDYLPEEFHRHVDRKGRTMVLPETTVRNSAGEDVPVRFSGAVLGKGTDTIGAAAFLQDIREYKRLEREKLTNERLAVVGQTVAQLSHGMKNILTGMQGGLYGIKAGIKRDDRKRLEVGWERLERNVARINGLVRGFLSYTKEHVPEVESTDLNTIAEEVHALYVDTARAAGVQLSIERAPGMRPVEVDPRDMHTCLANFVSNAIDACKEKGRDNGGELSVTIRLEERDNVATVEVVDTGCGMDEDTKNKVFNTFFTTKGLEGTGLGLLVTRKLIIANGGEISFDSAPEEGSVFRIELPRGGTTAPPAGP